MKEIFIKFCGVWFSGKKWCLDLYSEYLDNTLLSTFILSTLLRLSVPINDYSFMLSLPKKTLLSLVDNLFSTNPSLLSCSLYFIYRCIAEGQIDIWLEMEGFFDGLLNAYIGNSSNDRLLICMYFEGSWGGSSGHSSSTLPTSSYDRQEREDSRWASLFSLSCVLLSFLRPTQLHPLYFSPQSLSHDCLSPLHPLSSYIFSLLFLL